MRLPRPKTSCSLSPGRISLLIPAPEAEFDPRLLNLLCRSSLASIPQTLITPDQIQTLLSGSDVLPTPRQLDLTRRGKFLDFGEDLSKTA